jgi:lactate dehydrogenase-like 2-hydroxyacid dehydrogenase
MSHTVFYMSRAPRSHREVTISVQPPSFRDVWLESDDPAELRAKLAEADFIVGGQITAEHLALAPKLRMIQAPGVGYEHLDVEACEARGVPVAITPEGTVDGVAEHTIMMMLALYKHLTEAHNALVEGRWIHDRLRPICLMLQGKRVGIVGMGRIGRAVARRLQGWEVELVYHDIHRLPAEEEARLGAAYLPLDELLRTSDVVTLHVFLGPSARHLIGERELGLMQPTAILINTSRGAVVDEAAFYRALRDRRILAAGIDAWTEEPTPPDNPILRLDNVLATPHMATGNRDAMLKKSLAAYAIFERVLRGEAPINVVRPYRAVEAAGASPG